MNNEKMNQMIDEGYEKYERKVKMQNNWAITLSIGPLKIDNIGEQELLMKEEFINKCKSDPEFSENWGLKIEERELDMMERWQLAELTPNMTEFDFANYMCDKFNVPTRLITITYNSIKTDIYE